MGGRVVGGSEGGAMVVVVAVVVVVVGSTTGGDVEATSVEAHAVAKIARIASHTSLRMK